MEDVFVVRKKIVATILLLALSLSAYCLLAGCNKMPDKTHLPDFFGPELYDARVRILDAKSAVRLVVPLMTRLSLIDDAKSAPRINVEYKNGSAVCRPWLEKSEYSKDGYQFYNIVLEVDAVDPIGTADVEVENIHILYGEQDYINVKPQRIVLEKAPENRSDEDIVFNGTPLKLPADMHVFPLEVTITNKIVLKNIVITNNSLRLVEIDNGASGEILKPGNISSAIQPTGSHISLNAKFDSTCKEKSKERDFAQYVTSLLIEYQDAAGNECWAHPPILTTIYNPLTPDDESAGQYYEQIVKLGKLVSGN